MPKLGQTVIFNVSEETGNSLQTLGCNKQTQYPATVVAVWSEECVNLKVQVDGTHPDLWITSAQRGTEANQWQEAE
ncbi:hypothetical protein [Draconibacterium orientale]|uniref:hypothetical protein n=1 Tax=Draconibacterium orientale TaxID=1168034 RepID=UPI0029BFC2D6|nr:hypothetical protein [Draconibacterium orientale]